jgi:phospholipid/cholesterol/gamma-HCH transport system ATP-binding protein
MIENCVVEIDSLYTRFGSKEVHRGVSFKIRHSTITALIGASGSGKSVLLREVIGLHRPSSGKISVLGKDVWNISEREKSALRKRFGVLFQNGALFSALNVGDNVAVPLREQIDLPEKIIEKVVGLRLKLSGLELEAIAKMPSELSGGMRKRVALARALALEPELLFLDEPTSGLDPINARSFDRLIRALCDDLGITVVIATHDLYTLSTIVDHVIVLSEGKVLVQGSFEEVAQFDHPWTRAYFKNQTSDDD